MNYVAADDSSEFDFSEPLDWFDFDDSEDAEESSDFWLVRDADELFREDREAEEDEPDDARDDFLLECFFLFERLAYQVFYFLFFIFYFYF